jgi:hypothetical protein
MKNYENACFKTQDTIYPVLISLYTFIGKCSLTTETNLEAGRQHTAFPSSLWQKYSVGGTNSCQMRAMN